jgi:hypothetical protein
MSNWELGPCAYCGQLLGGFDELDAQDRTNIDHHPMNMNIQSVTSSPLDFDETDRTAITRDSQGGQALDNLEDEDDYLPTMRLAPPMSGSASHPHDVEYSHIFLGEDLGRTQVTGGDKGRHQAHTPPQYHQPKTAGTHSQTSSDIWSTPSQDAWASPYTQSVTAWGQTPNLSQRGSAVGRVDAGGTYYTGANDLSGIKHRVASSTSRKIAWGILVLFLCSVGFIAAYFLMPLWRTAPETPRQVFVVLELETTPAGATVWVDGRRQKDTTPMTISSRIGQRLQIQLHKEGYKMFDLQWEAMAHDKRNFFLQSLVRPQVQTSELDPKPPAVEPTPPSPVVVKRRPPPPRHTPPSALQFPSATLTLTTNPPGANVRVDQIAWPGRTPLRIVLRQGQRAKITIQKYGHQDAYFFWTAERNGSQTIHLYRHSWYNP